MDLHAFVPKLDLSQLSVGRCLLYSAVILLREGEEWGGCLSPLSLCRAWFPWSTANWPIKDAGIRVALWWLRRETYGNQWPDRKYILSRCCYFAEWFCPSKAASQLHSFSQAESPDLKSLFTECSDADFCWRWGKRLCSCLAMWLYGILWSKECYSGTH